MSEDIKLRFSFGEYEFFEDSINEKENYILFLTENSQNIAKYFFKNKFIEIDLENKLSFKLFFSYEKTPYFSTLTIGSLTFYKEVPATDSLISYTDIGRNVFLKHYNSNENNSASIIYSKEGLENKQFLSIQHPIIFIEKNNKVYFKIPDRNIMISINEDSILYDKNEDYFTIDFNKAIKFTKGSISFINPRTILNIGKNNIINSSRD